MFEIFGMYQFFFFLAFFAVFGLILASFIREGKRWRQDEKSPRLTVEVTVVSKRTNVSHHRHHHGTGHGGYTTHSTSYYATFQVPSGDRMELRLPGEEFGLLVEGDRGTLTFQGSRFLGFERKW